ncbi:hypothetical protein F4781DRAFT_418042 [Annulohypoxylon bovei var. microspora]|nr:hypothetical protein F4781DRAFT_418042 [Annulohypoxylon bovei var. microspora]
MTPILCSVLLTTKDPGSVTNIENPLTIIDKRFSITEIDTMKSILVLVTTVAVAATQVGYANANLDARSISLTSPDTPTFSSTPSYAPTLTSSDSSAASSSSDTATSSSSLDSSSTSFSAPSISTTPFANITTAGTATQTLGGITHSATISGSLTETPSASSTSNAAASPAKVGIGVVAGIFGILAAL